MIIKITLRKQVSLGNIIMYMTMSFFFMYAMGETAQLCGKTNNYYWYLPYVGILFVFSIILRLFKFKIIKKGDEKMGCK